MRGHCEHACLKRVNVGLVNVLLLGLICSCGSKNSNIPNTRGKLQGERTSANESKPVGQDWFNLNPELDGVEGESVARTYEVLANKKLAPRVVAVIDSGVDVNHEDLKGHIWANPGETGLDAKGHDKATNGIDDDGDGYVDDVNGWNFIGGYDADGKPINISDETLEKTRILRKLQKLLDSGVSLSDEDEKLYQKVKEQVATERAEATKELSQLETAYKDIETNYPTLAPFLKGVALDKLTRNDVVMVDSKDPAVVAAKDSVLNDFDNSGMADVARLQRFIKIDHDALDFNLNVAFDPRAQIVGDDPDDFSDVHYGNNDLLGPDADHGTHVAGMIAAERNNSLGIRGISETTMIMVLRVVPNGDERDKDVALAVRYAADHGANVINMSFGKEFSPNRKEVEDAFVYAQSKGVLMVHAAGNDAKDTTADTDSNFPTPLKINVLGNTKKLESWLEVGASSKMKGRKLPAAFSNYGEKSVDIFAPGYQVESTVPGNEYAVFSGTSMASPALAGAAALAWSVNPALTAQEVKNLLLKTGRTYPGLLVNQPTDTQIVKIVLFSKLSITGKIGDVLNAVQELLK